MRIVDRHYYMYVCAVVPRGGPPTGRCVWLTSTRRNLTSSPHLPAQKMETRCNRATQSSPLPLASRSPFTRALARFPRAFASLLLPKPSRKVDGEGHDSAAGRPHPSPHWRPHPRSSAQVTGRILSSLWGCVASLFPAWNASFAPLLPRQSQRPGSGALAFPPRWRRPSLGYVPSFSGPGEGGWAQARDNQRLDARIYESLYRRRRDGAIDSTDPGHAVRTVMSSVMGETHGGPAGREH